MTIGHKPLYTSLAPMLLRKSNRAVAVGSNWLRHRIGGQFRLHESVVVLAPPRSGSTWLTEVVGSWPGFGVINEPLHPVFVAPRRFGLQSRNYLPPAAADDLVRYLRAAFTGDVVQPFAVSFNNPIEPWTVKRWISKVVHGNGLIGWCAERLPEPQYVGLLRHPCAVIASQRRKNMISTDTFHAARLQFASLWPEFATVLHTARSEVARYAACWCMDIFALMNCRKPPRFRLVCYEDLVSNADVSFARLAEWIGADAAVVDPREFAPSASAQEVPLEGSAQLGKWKEGLTLREVDEVFGFLDAFRLDFYRKDSVQPDHRALRTMMRKPGYAAEIR
jgi:hypothetical protein